jgi:hypothetical protein
VVACRGESQAPFEPGDGRPFLAVSGPSTHAQAKQQGVVQLLASDAADAVMISRPLYWRRRHSFESEPFLLDRPADIGT